MIVAKNRPKIAFIVQRNGKEVNGGSETYCFLIAKLMIAVWDVEILTTCALDYMTWENYYNEGVEIVDGVPIRRFKVDKPRDIEKFNEFSSKIFNKPNKMDLSDAEQWMKLQGPLSGDLLKYIEKEQQKYDAFVFFTYLYATTYYGLQLVEKNKAFLVPTAHDEKPIYLPIWDDWFKKPQGFIINTIEERSFLKKRFPEVDFKGDIVGIGVDIPKVYSNIRFRQKYDIYAPYILYIGRIDESKGCGQLFEYFIKFKEKNKIQLKLVVAGKPVMSIPNHKDIIHIGFIDDQTKFDAIEGCEFLINPSPFESLSIVLLEAWSLNKPVLVNAKSKVMVGQCTRSNGGLWYSNYYKYSKQVNYLLVNSYKFTNLKKFIEDNYSWEIIKNKYLRLLNV